MKIVIVGCGLGMLQTRQVTVIDQKSGGLACAVACLRQGLRVVMLEKATSIQPVAQSYHTVEAGIDCDNRSAQGSRYHLMRLELCNILVSSKSCCGKEP